MGCDCIALQGASDTRTATVSSTRASPYSKEQQDGRQNLRVKIEVNTNGGMDVFPLIGHRDVTPPKQPCSVTT